MASCAQKPAPWVMKESERRRDTENKADLSQSKQKRKAQKSQKTH